MQRTPGICPIKNDPTLDIISMPINGNLPLNAPCTRLHALLEHVEKWALYRSVKLKSLERHSPDFRLSIQGTEEENNKDWF